MTTLRNGEKLDGVLADDSTEKLLPTRFAKIHMINGVHFNSAEFAQRVRALVQSAHRGSRQEIYQIFDELDIGFQTPIFKDVGQNEKEVRQNEDLAAAAMDVAPRKPRSGPPWPAVFPISGEKVS